MQLTLFSRSYYIMQKIFGHKLPTQDIIIRQDALSPSERIENKYGRSYPAIRLNYDTFAPTDIEAFNLTFGLDNKLPFLHVSINDKNFNQRDKNFVRKDDIMTIFVGNAIDEYHQPIKNDYYIIDANVDDSTGTYFIDAVLHVPDLYYTQNRVFVDKTSIEVLQFIAEECKLGFVTNITNSNDRMNWIQYQSNDQFIAFVNGRAYIDDNTKIEIFIDQFANLNVIDLRKSIESSESTTFITDIDGKMLEKDSAFRMTNWDYGKNFETDRYAMIDGFIPSNNEGSYARAFSEKLNIYEIKMETMSEADISVESNKSSLQYINSYTSFVNDNTFRQYDYAKQLNGNYNNHLYSNQKIQCSTSTYYPQLFLFLGLYVEIYDAYKMAEVNSQEQIVNSDNINEKVEANNKSLNFSSNEMYTGDYIVIGMAYSFKYAQLNSNEVRQHLTLMKR